MSGKANGVRYSVVVPVLNEAPNLEELYHRLTAVMAALDGAYELIFVDDGSRDESFEILGRLHAADGRLRVLRLMRNFGQHPAVTAGFDATRGEIIITLDADLQNPPEEIPKLVAKVAEGWDVATGVREDRKDPVLRRAPSRIVNWMIGKVTGVPLKDYGCMLRAYKRGTIELLSQCPEATKFITALVSWLGVSIAEVPVEHAVRKRGRSKYGLGKLMRMNFDLLTGFSLLPIQVIGMVGAVLAVMGTAALAILAVLDFLLGLSGLWPWWIVAALATLGGVQLAALGILGEYVGRIMVESKGRPYYIVRERLDREEET